MGVAMVVAVYWFVVQQPPEQVWERSRAEGDSAMQAGKYAEAERAYIAAIRILETLGIGDARLGRVEGWLAAARENRGDYRGAIVPQRRAVQNLEGDPSTPVAELMAAWEFLGTDYWRLRRLAEAERAYLSAFRLGVQKGFTDDRERFLLFSDLGRVYQDERKYADAQGYLDQGRSILARTPGLEVKNQVGFLNSLGTNLRMMGRFGDAEEALRTALGILDASGDRSPVPRVFLMSNLAQTYAVQKDYQTATEWFRRASELTGEDVPPYTRADLLQKYADCLRKNRDRTEARKVATAAKEILRSLPRERKNGAAVDVGELSRR